MKKQLRSIAFILGIGLAPLCLSPVLLHAQNENQRAYDAGYQNGVNDARAHREMNNHTDNWHGDRVNDYQRGYMEGYRSVDGGHDHEMGAHAPYADPEAQRAYESGFQNGVHDRERNRPADANSNDWHGDRLSAYQRGYDDGYHGGPH